MKASLFAQMGYAERHTFPATWPVPPRYHDPAVTMQSYEDGLEECALAEEMGFRLKRPKAVLSCGGGSVTMAAPPGSVVWTPTRLPGTPRPCYPPVVSSSVVGSSVLTALSSPQEVQPHR